jgi:hypothetical protein
LKRRENNTSTNLLSLFALNTGNVLFALRALIKYLNDTTDDDQQLQNFLDTLFIFLFGKRCLFAE